MLGTDEFAADVGKGKHGEERKAPPPRIALVLGGASSVWADVEAALALGEFEGVVGCNDAGVSWPGVMDAWVSLHASHFRMWQERRRRLGLPPHKALIGHHHERGSPATDIEVDRLSVYRFPDQDRSGSSGLFALKVALEDLGFDRAVLCGIPMTATPHFTDTVPWSAAAEHRKGWQQALPHIKDRARSMGGWTAELLGKPDAAWLSA